MRNKSMLPYHSRLSHLRIWVRTLTNSSYSRLAYFKRLSGYDTMRLVLADKVVLVEGSSDEMVYLDLVSSCAPLGVDTSKYGPTGTSISFSVDFRNLRSGLSYGLIWKWPTHTTVEIDSDGRYIIGPTHFGVFLESLENGNPRPSPEGEGGEAR